MHRPGAAELTEARAGGRAAGQAAAPQDVAMQARMAQHGAPLLPLPNQPRRPTRLPTHRTADWAKAAVWQHGGVGTTLPKSAIAGLPKLPVKSAFEIYAAEMLRAVATAPGTDGALKVCVRACRGECACVRVRACVCVCACV
jgi:hypothetical protein